MKAAVIAVLAVVLAVAAAQDMPSPQPAGKCPRVDGSMPVYLMDVEYRHMFYECNNGNPIRQTCPEGLVFDPKTNVCNYPCVDCEPSGPVGRCPEQIRGEKYSYRHLRDGSNIAVYYFCWQPYDPWRYQCPKGKYFNMIDRKCQPLA